MLFGDDAVFAADDAEVGVEDEEPDDVDVDVVDDIARVNNDDDDTCGDADFAATDVPLAVVAVLLPLPIFGDDTPDDVDDPNVVFNGRGDANKLSGACLDDKRGDFTSSPAASSRSSSSNRSSGSSSSSGSLDDGLSLNFGNFDEPDDDDADDDVTSTDDDNGVGVADESARDKCTDDDGIDESPSVLDVPGDGVVGVPELEPPAMNDGVSRGVPASNFDSGVPGTTIFGIATRPIIV